MMQSLDHLAANIGVWEARHDDQLALARRQWSADDPSWGDFDVPEHSLGLLPVELEGLDVVELGCGTAYVSAWMARRGARPVAVDPTSGQLGIARQFQAEFAVRFPLVRAAAEKVPLRDGAFDLVISEYGAAIWADPYLWIPEAARLLRSGGELVFLGNSTLFMLCAPEFENESVEPRLVRAQFGMHRFEWPDDPSVEFHLSHGDWIRLLRSNSFDIEDLLEIRPPAEARAEAIGVSIEWARQWPSEEVWRARKR